MPLTDEQKAEIVKASDQFQRFIEDRYQEMLWELSMKLGVDESIIKEHWEMYCNG